MKRFRSKGKDTRLWNFSAAQRYYKENIVNPKGVDTYEETTLVSFWKQPLFGVTQKGNNDETMRKQR